jgi:hypothetical protein
MNKRTPGIKDILVDLTVTAAILAAVVLDYQWLAYLVIGYTAFILAIKILVLMSEQLQAITAKSKSILPNWIYHLLYGMNVAALTIFSWYITAAAWVVIWGVSAYSTQK